MKRILFLFLTFAATAQSVQAASLKDAMEGCSQEQNSLKRLVCFDRLVKNMDQHSDVDVSEFRKPQTTYRPSQVAVATPQNEVTQSKPTDNFGIEDKIVAKLDKIISTVKSTKSDPFGKLTITLINGQVWKQADMSRLTVKKSDEVKIERGTFGSFMLSKTSGGKEIRVKRVK